MSYRRSEEKKLQKIIARRRIHYLFSLAEYYALQRKLNLSDRYVAIARKISMKYLVPIPTENAQRFCKHCYCYLLPPLNCRIRIHRGTIITYCNQCKKYSRIPLHVNFSTTQKSQIKN